METLRKNITRLERLLEEEVEVAVPVRVGELGARQVEAAEEGVADQLAARVPELDAVDDALPRARVPDARVGRLGVGWGGQEADGGSE